MRWGFAVALSCVVACWAHSARALDLQWSAPDGCAGRDELLQQVEQLLEQRGGATSAVRAEGEVHKRGGLFSLRLRLETGGQTIERSLQDRDCAALSRAAAWLISLSSGPLAREGAEAMAPVSAESESLHAGSLHAGSLRAADARAAPSTGSATSTNEDAHPAAQSRPASEREEQRDEHEPSAAPPVRARRAEAEGPAPEVHPAARPRTPWRVRMRRLGERWGQAGAAIGMWQAELPTVQATLALQLGLARGPLLGELSSTFVLPREQELQPRGRVRVSSYAVGLAGCWLPGVRVQVGPCALLTGFVSRGSVSGITREGRERVPWLATSLALRLLANLAIPLQLLAEVGIGVPLTARPTFLVDGQDQVVRASMLLTQAQVGLRYRWR